MSNIYQKYLKDESGNIISPIVSSESVYIKKGSILICDTNTPPNQLGTWELIDKCYKSLNKNNSSEFMTPVTSVIQDTSVAVNRTAYDIYIRMSFRTKVEITDSNIEIGTFNLEPLGLSGFYTQYVVGYTDGGNALFAVNVNGNNGLISIIDVFHKSGGSIAVNQVCNFNFNIPTRWQDRLDEACDKFYFLKTA